MFIWAQTDVDKYLSRICWLCFCARSKWHRFGSQSRSSTSWRKRVVDGPVARWLECLVDENTLIKVTLIRAPVSATWLKLTLGQLTIPNWAKQKFWSRLWSHEFMKYVKIRKLHMIHCSGNMTDIITEISAKVSIILFFIRTPVCEPLEWPYSQRQQAQHLYFHSVNVNGFCPIFSL